jgi:hypothetical protein
LVVNDEIAQMEADPEYISVFFRLRLISVRHCLLEFDSSPQGIHGATEFGQCAVASELDETAAISDQGRLEASNTVLFELGQRAGLVATHKARISDGICRQDGRQSSLFAFQRTSPRRPS